MRTRTSTQSHSTTAFKMADVKGKNSSLTYLLFTAFFLRIGFFIYGEWQDRTMVVKYTDIDYHVFTDAARHVYDGGSPYDRQTYRYTPLLAIFLTPNISLHNAFGKILFILFDVATGYLLYKIQVERGFGEKISLISSCLWTFNPIAVTVSSRGNAESIMAFLVLATLLSALKYKPSLTAVFLALAVHFKIYPIIYSLPIFIFIGSRSRDSESPEIPNSVKQLPTFLIKYVFQPARVKLVLIFIVTLGSLTLALYYRYGFDFLEHTYFYHVTRTDPKHNFSVYFYMLYLTQDSPWTKVIGLMSFIPQMTLTVGLAFKYSKDICFCCFAQTFAFVTFNKVCTSQYFLWYLCLLPLIAPQISMSLAKAVVMALAWFTSQGIWLYFAYYLEFEGQNTFLQIWISSLWFFFVNVWILCEAVKKYIPLTSMKSKKM